MSKIAVLVDSSADITNEEAKQHGLHVIRMPLTIDSKEYMEMDDIQDEEFIQKMKNGAIVKTAQPILGNLVVMWKNLLKEYDEVLFIPISSKLSGTYGSAVLASKDFDGKVTVVDAKMACYPLQFLAIQAKDMGDKGYSATEIKEKIENGTEMFAVIIPETLTYLKNGGRISPAAAALGNLLKIIPILKVDDGAIDVLDKVRTIKKAYATGLEYAFNVENVDDYFWFLVHSDLEKTAEEFLPIVEEKCKHKIEIHPIRAIIMAHTGPGTIGFGRIKKIDY